MFHYNPENKILQALSLYFDLVVLAAVWVITSVPVVTIGVSTTALYRVLFRMQSEDGVSHVVRSFFSYWRSEWQQSTAIWALLLVFLTLAGGNLLICAAYLPEGAAGTVLWSGAILSLLLALCLLVYVFPIHARFRCTIRQVFANAARFMAGSPGQTLVLVLLLMLMEASAFVLLALSVFVMGPVMYLSAKRLNAVFTPVVRRYEEEC